jgi:hypothetical protein
LITRVVRTTDIAKKIAGEPKGDPVNMIFGKIFEECYTEATWIGESVMNHKRLNGKFIAKMGAKMKVEGIGNRELLHSAYKMYAALLMNNVIGRKPPTEFRKVKNGLYIAAQPDIENDEDGYIEFKTYPINNYSRIQCEVFAWVLKEKVRLVGLRKNDDYYLAESETIQYNPNMDFSWIPDEMGKMQEFCDNCKKPIEKCRCGI